MDDNGPGDEAVEMTAVPRERQQAPREVGSDVPDAIGGTRRAPAMEDAETRLALAALVADMAVSTGPPTPAMRQTFADVVRLLGLSAEEGDVLLASAEATWDEPPGPLPESLCASDGSTTREALDLAYVRELARYDPLVMAQFGAPLAALAVHRLADLTFIYESDVAALAGRDVMSEAAG